MPFGAVKCKTAEVRSSLELTCTVAASLVSEAPVEGVGETNVNVGGVTGTIVIVNVLVALVAASLSSSTTST